MSVSTLGRESLDPAILSCGYFSIVFAELDDVAHLVLQVCLHGDVKVSLIIHGDSLKLLERAGKCGNWFQPVIRSVDIHLSKVFIGYIEPAIDVPKSFRRKRVSPID